MATVFDTPYDAYHPTAAYRLFDAEDVLLYAGCSDKPETRIRVHEGKWWGGEIARREIIWFLTRFDALAEEAKAIDTEGPKYNINRGIDRFVYVKLRDGRGPVEWKLDVKRMDWDKRMEDVEYGQHLLVYSDGNPSGILVPYGWYERACERLGDPVDLEALQAESGP